MSSCRHTDWVRIWKRGTSVTLEASDRPRRLLEDIVHVDQPAGFVTLFGAHSKSIALRQWGLPSGNSDYRSHGEFHLQLSYFREQKPIIIADGTLPAHNRLPWSPGSYRCHEVDERHFMPGQVDVPAVDAANTLYHRLLSPFNDVVCLFVQDVGGTDEAVAHLTSWADLGRPARPATSSVKPVLILAVRKGHVAEMQAALDAEARKRHGPWLDGCFRHVRIVALLADSRTSKGRGKQFQKLHRAVLHATDDVHQARAQSSLLFSARHLAALLDIAVQRAVDSPWAPLDFVAMSRISNPVAPDIATHLASLFDQFEDDVLRRDVGVPLAASSLILDHYPPGMHRKWIP